MATATTTYWQDLSPASPHGVPPAGPFEAGYPVRLPDGRSMLLPIRPLPDGQHAVASLIANQASFAVVEALADSMAPLARRCEPDILVGLPTLGLSFAPLVAQRLGHTRYVPLGYSRKFWYDETLSEPISSITSPGGSKQLYLDPNMLPLVIGRRVCLVDDAISSGASLLAVHRLFARLGIEVAAIVVAMKQTTRWQSTLAAADAGLPDLVKAVFGCPMFARTERGWIPMRDTLPATP